MSFSKGFARVAGTMLLASTLVLPFAGTASAEGVNCDANAVIWCGASSPSVVSHDYHTDKGDGHNTSASIQRIYQWFGINSSDISAMQTESVEGYVTKSGDVYAGGKLVATNALTAGRQNIAGSTTESYGGTTFYARQPSVSFLDSQLSAMVVMQNGQFKFAILHSCGNPVKATPVSVPKPSPKPTPTPTHTPVPTPAPTPVPVPVQSGFSCVSLTVTQPDKDNRPDTFDFTITPNVDNAQITGYIFTFSDESTPVNSSSATVERDDVTQPITVFGQVVTDQGTTPSGQCQVQVNVAAVTTVTTQTPTPTPVPQVLSATTMPQTGAESLLGGAAGVSGLVVAGRAYIRSRRSLANSIRNKSNLK